MVEIKEGEEPKKVPLVYYDEEGNRHIVGNAAVQIKNGEVLALGRITDSRALPPFAMSIEAFSLSDPGYIPELHKASRRLGPLAKGLGSRQYVTDSNPNGEVRQCNRRDLHEPHEWQAEFGAYFNVYCPGNTGSER